MNIILLLCIGFRIFNALILRTTFAPDEYWQSLEIAHRLVYGYGYLTWEWAAGLRSYAHPAIFAISYKILQLAGLDTPFIIIKTPLIVQSLLAALTDWHIYLLAMMLFGRQSAKWALVCQFTSWFTFYCSVRTHSNSMEAMLAVVGSYYYLKSDRGNGTFDRDQRVWLLCAVCSLVVRPSSAVPWAPFVLFRLWKLCRRKDASALLRQYISSGVLLLLGTLGSSILLDRAMYGRWVLVPWEFFKFNFLKGGSAQYGGHPWHWNLTQGLPTVFLTLLLPFFMGMMIGTKKKKALLYMAVLSIVTYSLPAHKEFRFLLPALQLLMPYCGHGAARIASKNRAMALILLAIQLIPGLYFSLWHHSGLLQTVEEIRRISLSTVLLTPCHAMPLYSHLHSHIPMRFLDCSPDTYRQAVHSMNVEDRKWVDLTGICPKASSERECFAQQPAVFLEHVLHGTRPGLIVAYSAQLQDLEHVLLTQGYRKQKEIWNCWIQTDDDTPCMLEIWGHASR